MTYDPVARRSVFLALAVLLAGLAAAAQSCEEGRCHEAGGTMEPTGNTYVHTTGNTAWVEVERRCTR